MIGRRERWRAWHVVGAVALVYIGVTLARFGGDPRAFAVICPDPSQVSTGRCGYDGQFAYAIAVDPIGAVAFMDVPAYRYQRIVYPLAARALGGGQAGLIAWTLILINLVALVAGTAILETIVTGYGVSRWYALGYGLFAGVMMPVRLDLTEPLAYALALGGVLAALRSRYLWSGVLLGMAALTKETTLLFAAAVAIACLVDQAAGWRRAIQIGLIALVPFILWQFALRGGFGEFGVGSGGALGTPFEPVPLRGWWSIASIDAGAFAVISLIMVPMAIAPALAGLVASARDIVRRRVDLPALLLLMNAAVILVTPQSTFREPLGMARLMAGLVAATLIYAAARRSRRGLNYSMLWIATLALALNDL